MREQFSVDFTTSLINLFGPGESGKSNFLRWLLQRPQYHRHVIFDPQHEYDPDTYNVYRPDSMEYEQGNKELNKFVKALLDQKPENRPRYIVIDEAANYLPGGQKPMGQQMQKIAYHNTHYHPGITLITANRHPTDLNKSIREMFTHMLVFNVRGENAKRTLRGMASGAVDAVEQTDMYEFVHVNQQGDIRLFDPVPDMGEYERV